MSHHIRFAGVRDFAAVRAFLTERDHHFDDKGSAFYENPTTGVYFDFALDPVAATLTFHINYFRPHVFGLEAEHLLTPLVDKLALVVADNDEDDDDLPPAEPYTAAGFLRDWNAGNRGAYRALADNAWLSLPAARNAAAWRWNFAKTIVPNEVDADEDGDFEFPCFVPTVVFVQPEGQVTLSTAAIWDLDIATAIPEVDLLVVEGPNGLRAAPRAELVALVDVHSTWDARHEIGFPDLREIGSPAVRVDRLSPEARKRVHAAMRPFAAKRITTDAVLDAELF